MFGAVPFSPLSLSPALWLSDTGSDPSVWPDISGNGRHATQATAANQPAIIAGAINGRQVRRTDGTNDFLETSNLGIGDGNYSLMLVSIPTPIALYRGQVSLGAEGSTNELFLCSTNGGTDHTWLSYASSYKNMTTGPSGLKIRTLVVSSNHGYFYVNGSLISDGDLNPVVTGKKLFIGKRARTGGVDSGDFAEILALPTDLSELQRQQCEAFLNAKYAIY